MVVNVLLRMEVKVIFMNLNKLLALSVLAYGNVVLGMFNINNDELSFKDEDIFSEEIPICYKVLLIGDQQVGKTQIFNIFKLQDFSKNYEATTKIELFSKELKIAEEQIKLKICDTSGDDSSKETFLRSFSKNFHAIVFVYDIDKKESFENIQKWITDVQRESNNENNFENAEENNDILNQENKKKDTLYFLVGNKTDLRNNNNGEEQVTTEEGEGIRKHQ